MNIKKLLGIERDDEQVGGYPKESLHEVVETMSDEKEEKFDSLSMTFSTYRWSDTPHKLYDLARRNGLGVRVSRRPRLLWEDTSMYVTGSSDEIMRFCMDLVEEWERVF